MRLLGTYLWKEWRDHRAVLVGMVLAVPLLLVVMGLSLPRTALDGSDVYASNKRSGFAAMAALACFALFVVSLATDLVPGEARRGHRWFLERLPGGLGAAFRGKLGIFALGGALFAAYGYLAAAVMCRVVAGEWPSPPSLGTPTWIIAIVALWTFAVSCSLPRGALSLPAVAALALLLALPAILLWMLGPWRSTDAWVRWESGALWAAGGVVAAWVAFRRRGLLRAGRACLAVGAVCAMPYWADAAHDAWDWHRKSVVVIEHSFLGEGGAYAFVNRAREGVGGGSPVAPVIVDLRDGSAREVGTRLCRFDAAGCAPPHHLPYRFAYLWDAGTRNDLSYYDTRTATERARMTEEDWSAARRARPIWRFADGRTAWWNGARLVVGEVEEPGVRHGGSPCGLGLETWTPRGYYDFGRERYYPCRGLALRGEHVWVRPGGWLTRKRTEHRLFDPDANAFSPALGFAEKDEVRAILDDGRVVVFRSGDGTLLVAPEDGAVTRIAMPKGFENGAIFEPGGAPMRTPDGGRIFMLYRDGRIETPPGPYRSACVRQDGDAFVATAALDGCVAFLGCPTDDEVIVHDDRAIYRLRFGSDVKEEIWRVR
jgi:hypothetical protein